MPINNFALAAVFMAMAALLMTTAGPVLAAPPAPSVSQPTLRDVTYCTVGRVDLKMDVYLPDNSYSASRPAVVYVHGGGWVSGDKRSGAGSLDISELIGRGYVVASLNYRLAPQYKFPAQIEDVKCAIRSLRANSAIHHINPDHIGAWGGSAGGHLVSLLGVTDQSAGFDVGQYLEQSSRVQAVVDYFGPSDLTSSDFGSAQRQQILTVFGSTDALGSASPITYITKDDSPFLIVQGELDTTVPPHQSQELYDRLGAAGVPATLVMVKNAGHSFKPVGGPISPTRPEITKMMADFFDRQLRSNGTVSAQTTTGYQMSRSPSPVWAVPVVAVAVGIAAIAVLILKRKLDSSAMTFS